MSQSVRTPPPCPPRAAIVILVVRAVTSGCRLQGVVQASAVEAQLQHSDYSSARRMQEAIPARGVGNQLETIERGAKCRGLRHLAAHAAADAAVVNVRDWIGAQRIGVFPDGERRTAGQADAGVVAGAG